MLLMEVSKCQKNSWISKNFNQNENFKTFWESQTASCLKEIIQPPPDKNFLCLWTKILQQRFTGICKHLLSNCFENAVFGRLEMVQCKCFFLTPTRNMYLAVLRTFIMLSELRFGKWLRLFAWNCTIKMSDLFC